MGSSSLLTPPLRSPDSIIAMSSPSSRRRLRWGLVVLAVMLAIVGAAVAVILLNSPGNESHPNVEFTAPTAAKPKPPAPVFEWPRYGYDAARTRYFPSGHRPDPPFRQGWVFQDSAPLGFPPMLCGNTMFFVYANRHAQ